MIGMTHTLLRQNEEPYHPRYLIYESLIRRYPILVPRTGDPRFPSLCLFRCLHRIPRRHRRPLPDIRSPAIQILDRWESDQ